MANNGLEKSFVRDPCGAEQPHHIFAFFCEIKDPFNSASS